jgi:hypothetical protein
MRLNILSVAFAILLSLVFLDSASAEGRCGPGFHRNPYGRCTPNDGRVVVPPAAPVVVAPETPVVVAPAPAECSGGFRWHPKLRRCVVTKVKALRGELTSPADSYTPRADRPTLRMG